jgi:hypothetical protein
MRRRAPVDELYGALFAISSLRDEVGALAGKLNGADLKRLLSRIAALESAALQLVESSEEKRPVAAH